MSDDRTSEFLSLASSLGDGSTGRSNGGGGAIGGGLSNTTTTTAAGRSSAAGNVPPRTTPLRAAAYEELRTFHRTAAGISEDISLTSDLLAELTRTVRVRTLFLDDSDRVNDLVSRIKANVENLNARLEESQKVIRQQKRRLGDGSQAGQEADNVVGQLREDFVRATTGFKAVLQQRSDWMRERTERKRDVFGGDAGRGNGGDDSSSNVSNVDPLAFMGTKPAVYGDDPFHNKNNNNNSNKRNPSKMDGVGAAPLTMPMLDLTSGLQQMTTGESTNSDGGTTTLVGADANVTGGFGTPNALRNRHGHASGGYAPLDVTGGGDAAAHHALTPVEMQRLDEESGNAQAMRLIPDRNYLRERADAMTTVESNIVELGTIFNKLAVMVNEHQEVVQRLEDNVNDASSNVTLSMETLTRTLTDLTTNRALFGKVLGIMVVFIIMFITFFA